MANATAMFAVQAQVYTSINVPAVLNLFGTGTVGVFDEVPEGKTYPYVEIGEIEEMPDNTMGKNGRSLLVSIHIYSDQAGYLEAEKIVEALNLLLDENVAAPPAGKLPDPTGWHVWENTYEQGSLQKEFDQVEIRHAIARYRVNVQQ